MAEMTLKVKVNDLLFEYQLWVSHKGMSNANLVILAQICNELSCKQGQFYGRTDRRTDAGNENTPLAWMVKEQKATILQVKGFL